MKRWLQDSYNLPKRIDSNSRNRELCNCKLRELIKLRKSWKKTPTVYLIGPYGHGKSSIIDSLLTAIDSYAEVVKWDAPVSSLPSVNGISTPTTMEVTKYTLRTVDLDNPKETVKLLDLVDTRGWAIDSAMSPEIIRFMVKESIIEPDVVFSAVMLVLAVDTPAEEMQNVSKALHLFYRSNLRFIFTKNDSLDRAALHRIFTVIHPALGHYTVIRNYIPNPNNAAYSSETKTYAPTIFFSYVLSDPTTNLQILSVLEFMMLSCRDVRLMKYSTSNSLVNKISHLQ